MEKKIKKVKATYVGPERPWLRFKRGKDYDISIVTYDISPMTFVRDNQDAIIMTLSEGELEQFWKVKEEL